MRDYESVLSGMMCCFASVPVCSRCPYNTTDDFSCKKELFKDILDYMTKQDKRILSLCSQLKRKEKDEGTE